MELKPYQQQVIADLGSFLEQIQETKDVREAFHNFWLTHPVSPLTPFPGAAIEPYKNNVPGVPHVCVKVPTAGGKTFIACNALKTIFDAFDYDRSKAVVWLVPSITILDQTIKNLKDTTHPYRQKINTHFGSRVEVYDKAALLQGSGFNATSVKEQLSIFVLSFDSLRARNKEDRKVYQENSNLLSFSYQLSSEDDISLMAVIQSLNPIVVVDESHNAETDLSVEMLKNLNPCFILDLTATPRRNSNIISFVDALALKREHMVKLPVIVYNHHSKTDVINSALQLQRRLELQAKEEEKDGGRHIRPIVLFQAQSRGNEDNTTYQKLKELLISLKIPEEQIKIKVDSLNELKGIDLMAKDCPVRYIITVNALKEGWDCPFAYILASLADRSSAVDVEQILGRVLRQPYVMKHKAQLLNMSYVLTASGRFMETLGNIVKGLNKAGFSEKDYKLPEAVQQELAKQQDPLQQLGVFDEPTNITVGEADDILADIDTTAIQLPDAGVATPMPVLDEIEKTAIEQNEQMERIVAENDDTFFLTPTELEPQVKKYTIKEVFRDTTDKIALPQFYLKVQGAEIFDEDINSLKDEMLDKENLLDGFQLSKADTNIAFDSISADLYKVDLDETKKEHTPTFVKLDGKFKEGLMAYILDPSRKGSRVKSVTKRIMEIIGNMYPIADREIERYINRVLEDFTDEQFNDFADKQYSYIDKIKKKIQSLSEQWAEKRFKDYLDTDKVFIKNTWQLPASIAPGETAKDITKSLYEKEGKINGFEERVINEIANLPNIAFWTRNIERKGFAINGFINHYPDFIIYTKSGKIIVLETKGDHLDAEAKIRLGNLWTGKAGNNYKYFMVYEKRVADGAYTLDKFMELMKEM